MADLTEKARELIGAPNFAYLATIMPDGSPQVSPMWVDARDGHVLLNTAIGRVKEQNARREPRVGVTSVEVV